MEDIIVAVMNENLFGMVECDIRVPVRQPTHLRHPTMTSYEYFSEMSPLFCTSDIPFDVRGHHMQNHMAADYRIFTVSAVKSFI